MISSAFSLPFLPRLALRIKLASFVVEISESSSGVEYFSNNCLLVVPKVSQKTVVYSGKTRSKRTIVRFLRLPQISQTDRRNLERFLSASIFSEGNICFRIASEPSKISNHDAVEIIVLYLTNRDFSECGSLNGIEYLNGKFPFDEKEIELIPIVPRRF